MSKIIVNGKEYISVNEINDAQASTATTYSSSKIEELIASIPSGGGSITRVRSFNTSDNIVQTRITVEKEEE